VIEFGSMNPLIWLGLLAVGFAGGLLYFLGLWWTLERLPSGGSWTGRIMVSFLVRVSVVLVVFYFFMEGSWQRVFVMTLGFISARLLIVRRIRRMPIQDVVEESA